MSVPNVAELGCPMRSVFWCWLDPSTVIVSVRKLPSWVAKTWFDDIIIMVSTRQMIRCPVCLIKLGLTYIEV